MALRSFTLWSLAAAMLAGCAGTQLDDQIRAEGARDLDRALAGYVAGETQSCVDPHLVDGPQVIGNTTLLYRSGNRMYRNDLIGPCPSLRSDSTIITEINGGQLCRNDMFRPLEPGSTIPGSYCRLGNFIEYTRAPS